MTVLFCYTFPTNATSPGGVPTPPLHKDVGPARVFLTPHKQVCGALGCEVEERERETCLGRGAGEAGRMQERAARRGSHYFDDALA